MPDAGENFHLFLPVNRSSVSLALKALYFRLK